VVLVVTQLHTVHQCEVLLAFASLVVGGEEALQLPAESEEAGWDDVELEQRALWTNGREHNYRGTHRTIRRDVDHVSDLSSTFNVVRRDHCPIEAVAVLNGDEDYEKSAETREKGPTSIL